jgi:chromosome segregation ATPase
LQNNIFLQNGDFSAMTLEEKIDAIYNLAMETAHFAQSVADRLTVIEIEVTAIREDIAVLKTDVAELKTDVAILKTDVAELKTDVAILKTDVAELKTDVAILKTDVAELKNGQHRLEQRLILFDERINTQQIHIKSVETMHAQFENRLKRIEDIVIPLPTSAPIPFVPQTAQRLA